VKINLFGEEPLTMRFFNGRDLIPDRSGLRVNLPAARSEGSLLPVVASNCSVF
jgi:hypothetical protein